MDATVTTAATAREEKLHALLWAGVKRVLQENQADPRCLVVAEDDKLYLLPNSPDKADLTDLEPLDRQLDHKLMEIQEQCNNWRNGYGRGWPNYVVQMYAMGLSNMWLQADLYDMRLTDHNSHLSTEMKWLAQEFGLDKEDRTVFTSNCIVYKRPAYALSRDFMAITCRPAQLIGSKYLQSIAQPYADYAHERCALLAKQKADAIAVLQLYQNRIDEKQAGLPAGTLHVELIRSVLHGHLVPDVLRLLLEFIASKTILSHLKQ